MSEPRKFFISTLKESPAEAEVVSHRLMLRAGHHPPARRGIYTWLPLGLRVLRKVEAIVREEMNRAGALELAMPAVQPAELWQESGRWAGVRAGAAALQGPARARLLLQPDPEEVISDIARAELKSYRQLPVHFYQIQTKFRDEIRPRFGVMRGREFVMKDGYSFHADYEDLRARVPQHARHLHAHLHAAGPQVPRGGRRSRRRSAAPARTSSTCSPTPARTRSPISPGVGLCRQRRARGGGRAPATAPRPSQRR